MNKLFERIEEPLMNISAKFASSRLLATIMASFMMLLPINMIGSFAALLRGLPFEGYQAFIASTGIHYGLTIIYQFTINYFAIYIAFAIGYQFAQKFGLEKNAVSIGIISLLSFMIATPYTHPERGPASVLTEWYGASGLFTAVIIGFIVGGIFLFCQKNKIEIKMPESVPPMIANQFTALIPAVICTIVFAVVEALFGMTSFGSIHNCIYSLIRTPLMSLGANIWGYLICMLMVNCLWFLGIHGGMTLGPVMMMLFTELQLQNQMAYAAGQPLPNMFTGNHLSTSNGSLAVIVACLIVAKSSQAKFVSRTAVVPSLFGVDEPAYFGYPMILNPIFFIPWAIIRPIFTVLGTHLLHMIGLLPYYTGVRAGGFVPFFVNNLLGYGVPGLIWGFVFFAIDVMISIPFVRMFDRQLLKEENPESN